jgi:predicted Zn-dependent protease
LKTWGLPLLLALFFLSSGAQAQGLLTDVEKLIGEQVARALRDSSGVDDDPLLRNWVQRVGRSVAEQSTRQDVRYQFRILGTDAANALAAPGGYIFVTRGLLDTIDSDDELAAVLGHEVGHVQKKHAMQQIGANVLFLVLSSRIDDSRVRTGATVFNILRTLNKSREMEAQADEVGLGLTQEAGYDPHGLVSFFEGLGSGNQSRIAEYFSTHPSPKNRIQDANKNPLLKSPDAAQVERRAEGFASRGLRGSAEQVRAGKDPLAFPPAPEVPIPTPLAQERAGVVRQSESLRRSLTGAYKARRVGATLQQILLINSQPGDYRWLWVATRAYQVQQYVDDVYARTLRLAAVAPGTYDALSPYIDRPAGDVEGLNASIGRGEVRRALEKLNGAPRPLERAATTVATVIAELNNRFLRTNNDVAWLRYGALEGALRYAESELARADKASGEAWRLMSLARIRRYEAKINALVPEDNEARRALWYDLATRRFGTGFPPDGPAGSASVRAALAVQLSKPAEEIEAGRGDITWAEWTLRKKGTPENIATAVRLLALDLERETAAEDRHGTAANH